MSLVLKDSTAMHLGENIDCRYLTLSIEVHDWETPKTQSFVLDVLDWVNGLVNDNFVSSWKMDNRSVGTKRFSDKAKERIQEGLTCFFGLEAYWKNEKVKTKQQLHQWRRFVQYGTSMMGWPPPGWSVDFADYWNNNILPYARDKAALQQAITQLFHEKGRYAKGVCYTPDVECAIFINSQADTRHLRQGSIFLSVSAFALAELLSETAEMWKEKLIELAQKYGDLDGRVMLQPRTLVSSSPYMVYFDDGQKRSLHYLPGVEWANVLSSGAQELLAWKKDNGPCEDTVQYTFLPGGCLLFASRRSILEYDVDDALLLKAWLKEALFPGPGLGYSLPLMMKPIRSSGEIIRMPRKDWAIVPVLEEEIEIWDSQLRFYSNTI